MGYLSCAGGLPELCGWVTYGYIGCAGGLPCAGGSIPPGAFKITTIYGKTVQIYHL